MYRLLLSCFIMGVVAYGQQPAPQHSADSLPDTKFSCRDKVLGGYYADPDAQCQMFHVCVKVAGVGIQDFRFLCPNGTAFDQEAQICAGWQDVACDSTALYYSSDNFDLYRIGSGFESKKAPAVSEEESDFHLQRAEPDIFSGAHSSNFFNKDGRDSETGQNKNQVVDQPQRKKVIRKLQRRPTEITTTRAPAPPAQPARQFTNNFAGSYVPTTSRPTVTTARTQPPQYNNENSNYNQRNNDYQSYKQPSSTAVPYESTKYSKPAEQSTPQSRNVQRTFKSRQPSTPDYSNYNNENNQNYQNKQNDYYKNDNLQYNNNNNNNNRQQSSTADYGNYNAQSSSQPSTPRNNFNKERKQPTYQAQQTTTTTKSNYNADVSQQYNANKQAAPQYNDNKQAAPQYNDNKQSSVQYNNNNDQYNYNQQSTPNNNNYNSESTQKYKDNKETSYNINYSSKSVQQSTPQYNQQYSNQDNNQYKTDVAQPFEKVKSTTKYVEKKPQYNAFKQSTPQYNTDNTQYNNNQGQTPAPKFNTNLQYDNNQQSTPNYNGDFNQQRSSSQAPSSTYQQQQYSTAGSSSSADYNSNNNNNNFNQQYQQKSSPDYSQYSTARPAPSSNAGVSQQYNQQNYEQKSSAAPQQFTTARPATAAPVGNNQQVFQKASAAPFRSNKPEDYDDGQYRPELYERESGGQYDKTARQGNTRQRQDFLAPAAPEPELLKAAHSINIAASGNQLARDNRQRTSAAPSSTLAPFTLPPRISSQAPQVIYSTAAPVRNVYTTSAPASARSVYSSFAAVTSAAPRPFSARPVPSSTSPPQKPVAQPKQAPIPAKQDSHPSPAKSSVPKKAKDVSYDYQYYDNSDHYSEYENIEEFGRTSKKQ